MIERQDERKSQQRQGSGEEQGFFGADRTGGKRTLLGALDLPVKVTVGVVIYNATRRAH